MSRAKQPSRQPRSSKRSAPPTGNAVDQARELTKRRPDEATSWHRLGKALFGEKRYQEACTSLERALDLSPNDPDILCQLGRAKHRLGDSNSAKLDLERALALRSDLPEAHRTLSDIFSSRSQHAAAITHGERACELLPNSAACLSSLALALANHFDLERARELYQRATELDSTSYIPWNNLGGIESQLGNLDGALSAYRRAHRNAPHEPVPYSNLLTTHHYHPESTPSDIRSLAHQWNELFAVRPTPSRPDTERRPDKRLRIGLLSDGFRGHPVGRMVTATLEQIDPAEATLIFYTTNNTTDAITQRLQRKAEAWVPVKHLSDIEFAQRVRDDDIDILFDLCGHNAGTRMPGMSMQPAPLLVKWVGGLINTTGVQAIDYLLSDAIETPPGCDDDYVEKIIRLPDDYICFEAPDYTPAVSPLPAANNGYITLGCFNNATKLNEVVLSEWAKIMATLKDSRLLLKSQQLKGLDRRNKIINFMASRGIGEDRLILEGPSPHAQLLKTYHRVDIALDPWPYSGGLTTCEAFTMGVPVVSLPGPTFAGRHSATHLINAGMPELVVNSWEEYRERVVELASDLDSLATIRQHLREVLKQSPVCDAKAFAQHFTTAVRAIWQRHCSGKAPEALTFAKDGRATFADEAEPVTLVAPAPLPEEERGFQWRFDGRVILVDNGGKLLSDGNSLRLLDQGALGVVTFDPTSRIDNPDRFAQRDDIDLFAHTTLGDGQTGELHVALDPAYSSVLAPLDEADLAPALRSPMKTLTRLPISTVALDAIEGLPAIDWLTLDMAGDTMAILEHGAKALQDALILQIQVPFQPLFQGQADFAQVSHWASRHGFRFRQFLQTRHSPLDDGQGFSSTQWQSADALFVPSNERTQVLSQNQRAKLAFLLSVVFGADDAALEFTDDQLREQLASSLAVESGEDHRSISSKLHVAETGHWKATIASIIQNNSTQHRRPHNLPGSLIVSLTSYPKRYTTLSLTLESLLQQTIDPDLIILWISHEDMADLPADVLSFKDRGLEIRGCSDHRSYKKIIPTSLEFPNAFIVTADDDIYYPPSWLEELADHHEPGSKTIIAHRTHRIVTDDDGNPAKYSRWHWNYISNRTSHPLNFPTSGAGVLYPPGCFHDDFANSGIFLDLAPDADDIWLYWMARLKGYSFRGTGKLFELTTWPTSQAFTLFEKNICEGNDQQISNMVRRFGFPSSAKTNASS